MTETNWLSNIGWPVLIAFAAAMGAIIGELAKSSLSKVFDTHWTERREARKIYEKYKNPLALSAAELANRLTEIIKLYPTTFLRSEALGYKHRRVSRNSDEDSYYKKYKLISTLYRFCSFLGWLEIYRRDTVFLASGNNKRDKKIRECIAKFRSAVSDGHINKFENWRDWHDHLIFREELRAIGESMVKTASGGYQVLGYADFESDVSNSKHERHKWTIASLKFFSHPEKDLDFRLVRFCLMHNALCELLVLLTNSPLSAWLLEGKCHSTATLIRIGNKAESGAIELIAN